MCYIKEFVVKLRYILFSIGVFSLTYQFLPEYTWAMEEESERKSGLGFATAREREGQFYFDFQDGVTEQDYEIRKIINTTPNKTLLQQYSDHIKIFETTSLSTHKCHEYALAKILGYQEIPGWINLLENPAMFDCTAYLESTSQLKEGYLVAYYNGSLKRSKHFGFMGSQGRVISTWGSSSDDAFDHDPFFVDHMYGELITVWAPKAGEDMAYIRLKIEQKLIDEALNKIPSNNEREEIRELGNKLRHPKMNIDNVVLLLNTIRKIDVPQRQEVVATTAKLAEAANIIYDRADLIIDAIGNISLDKRSLAIESLKSLIKCKSGKLLIQGDRHSTNQEVFCEKSLIHMLSTLSKMEAGSIPDLVKATQLLMRSSMHGENVSDILEGLERCSKKHKIDPIDLANLAYPLFVNNMSTTDVDKLFTAVYDCVEKNNKEKIAKFAKSDQVNNAILSLGGSFIAYKLAVFR